MVNIYDYMNYRDFLRDYLNYKKEKNRSFTHREILKKMGINSTGFLSNIFSGKKNLNEQHVEDLQV